MPNLAEVTTELLDTVMQPDFDTLEAAVKQIAEVAALHGPALGSKHLLALTEAAKLGAARPCCVYAHGFYAGFHVCLAMQEVEAQRAELERLWRQEDNSEHNT